MREPAADLPGAPPREPTRRRPPIPIAIIGALFLALGCLDLYKGLAPLARGGPTPLAADNLLVGAIGVAALAGGIFLLHGRNWARWLLAAWMALHVGISLGQPIPLVAHTLVFGVIAFLLFRPATRAYFRHRA